MDTGESQMGNYAIAILFFIYFALGFCAAIVTQPPKYWPTLHILAHWVGWITAWPVIIIWILIFFYIVNGRFDRQDDNW